MLRNRLFNVLIAILLVTVVAFTVREAFATTNIVSRANAKTGAAASECASLPSRYSLRTEYVQSSRMSVPYTEDGPTGVDGGLIELLSNYRTCSR